MATSYQAIIDAIDAAMLSGVSGPGELTTSDGRTIKFRSLSGLMATRKSYERLLANSRGNGGMRYTKIRRGR